MPHLYPISKRRAIRQIKAAECSLEIMTTSGLQNERVFFWGGEVGVGMGHNDLKQYVGKTKT